MVGESQEAVGAGVGGGSSGSNKMPTLEEYGTNLTTQAEEVHSNSLILLLRCKGCALYFAVYIASSTISWISFHVPTSVCD